MIKQKRGSSLKQSDNFPSPNWNYETSVAQVESIIEEIEGGQLELAEVVDQFAIAVEQLRQCEKFLNTKQQQMDLLIETLEDDADLF
jgi:exodeoxyribonuclease VII small subunit